MQNILFVYPGQTKSSNVGQDLIKTVLGSCVSVCLWDPENKVAGMCHYLLTEAGPGAKPSGRYGQFAIDLLIAEMLENNANRNLLQASIFGGGAVVDALSTGSAKGIGDRNIEFAEQKCKQLGLKIRERHVGGNSGLRIALSCSNGQVNVEVMDESGSGDAGARTGVSLMHQKALTRVLIVDDSATVRTILKNTFDRSKKISVVGTAVDPFDARDKIVQLKPDIITLDIEMPKMNGIQFLEKLMKHHPMPVVIVSSLSAQGPAADRAMELGAVEFVHKPSQFDPTVLSDLAETLIPKVIGAANIDISSMLEKRKNAPPPSASVSQSPRVPLRVRVGNQKIAPVSIIGVSGNGGSSEALVSFLQGLANDTPPVIVAISTIAGFAKTWIEKHHRSCRVKLEPLVANAPLQQGVVYFCHEDLHVKVVKQGSVILAQTMKAAPVSGQRPSGDILFESLAEFVGSSSIAVMLSGYGKDGVDGLSRVRDAGGWTIAQHPNDCSFNFNVVAALETGCVDEVANRTELAAKVYDRRSAAMIG